MQQIYRRTPIPKCDFNKVALQVLKVQIVSLYFKELFNLVATIYQYALK